MFERIIAKHRAYFNSGKTLCPCWREKQLAAIETMLHENAPLFHEALWKDLRRNQTDADLADVTFLAKKAAYTRKCLRSWMKPEKISSPAIFFPSKAHVRFEPLGLVLIIGTWNYPFFLTLSPLIGAIAAGNTAVIKFSEHSHHCAELMNKLFHKYLDPEAFTVVLGGADVGSRLLECQWDHICYTGGAKVARLVMTAAAKHLTPVILELGGKNGTVVHSSANLKVSAQRIAYGCFANAGQTCTRPDYLLVYEDVYDEFLEILKKTIVRYYGENPQKSPDFGRIINTVHFDRISGLLSSGNVYHGGQSDRSDLFIAPTILTDVPNDSPVMQEEIFGPIIPAIKVINEDDVIQRVRQIPTPLGFYIFGSDKKVIKTILNQTKSGGVAINDCGVQPLCSEYPFGGVGQSGMGKYNGRWGFLSYSNLRGVLDHSTLIDPSFKYPPYSKGKFIRNLMLK